MNLSVVQNVIRRDIKTLGVAKTLYDVWYKAINKVIYFRVLNSLVITEPDPHYLGGNSNYTYRFLTPDELLIFAQDPTYDLEAVGLQLAFQKEDQCFGILDGDRLTSYGWYSNKPTVSAEGLQLHFNDKYIYMYQGYTHHDYRGQRLHAIGMTMALQEILQRGFKGIVSCVDATNFSSLKSVYRMGYKDFGKLYTLKIFGRYITYRSKGCKHYGFWLEQL